MPTLSYPGTPGTTLYAGLPTPSVGGLITTISLVNTSGSTQAANFVSPMMGMPFVQGDLPSGEYPVFTLEDDTPCPATIWGVTTWPDGSMKWCGAMIRVPTSIAGSGTLTINVSGGGSAPASSARATSDLTAADLKVELTGVTNLSGVWTASLNTAITDASEIVQIGDGPAGRIYRIRGALKQSGSAHGQLEGYHYAAILQNSVNGLLGLRYLGRVAQPWADVASPTPTRRVATAVLKSGATTIRTLTGHDTTETVGSNIGIPHYSGFFTAGADATWDYVQGGGSASADCTVRVVHSDYFIKTRMVPPYDTSLTPTVGTSVDYVPYCKGSMQVRATGTTGPRDEIGVFPTWAIRHILTQSATDERNCRVTGLASGGWRTCHRKAATGQIVPVTDPQSSYTGMGTPETTWMYYPGSNVSGIPAPAIDTSIWGAEMEPSHRGACSYYPYLLTGEPQYWDLLSEQANSIILSSIPGVRFPRTGTPITNATVFDTGDFGERNAVIGGTTYKGGGLLFRGSIQRPMAWGSRDIAQAAAMAPDVSPYGAAEKTYFNDVTTACFDAALAYIALRPAPWQASGMWSFSTDTGAGHSPWNAGYMSDSFCHQASILATADSAAFRGHLAKYWAGIEANMDVAAAGSYNSLVYDENGTRAESSADMFFAIAHFTLTFDTATSRGTVGGDNGLWSPTNGDVFVFMAWMDPDKPFAAAVDGKKFYAVNCTGKTMQLSETPGGSPVTVTSNVVVTDIYAQVANFSPNFSFQGTNASTEAYMVDNRSAVAHHVACGDTVAIAAHTAMQAKVTAMGISFTANPSDTITTSYPA